MISGLLSPRVRWFALAVLAFDGSALQAAAAPAPSVVRSAAPKASDAAQQRTAEPDATSRNVMARTRMLECGHQWNSLKKSGSASGTWKDFSRGCLAQR